MKPPTPIIHIFEGQPLKDLSEAALTRAGFWSLNLPSAEEGKEWWDAIGGEWDRRYGIDVKVIVPEAGVKIKSTGGSTSYYDLPHDSKDIGDLIEYRKMTFNVANIFKACYRLGEKDGTDDEYDLNKMIYFAKRELAVLAKRCEAA